jgi:hypothetical protein
MEVWKIGDVKVTRVLDLEMRVSPRFLFPDASPENLAPTRAWETTSRVRWRSGTAERADF